MDATSQRLNSQHNFDSCSLGSREKKAHMRARRARAQKQAIEKARKRRALRKARIFALVVVALIVCGAVAVKVVPSILSVRFPFPTANVLAPSGGSESVVTANSAINQDFDPSSLYSSHAILIDEKTGDTLFSKGGSKQVYPASLTKIMSAVVVLESKKDLSVEVELDNTIFAKVRKEDASVAGFMPGERVKAKDLLYGMMLSSGADCTLGLANYVAGSEDRFVDLMNAKAKTLGMKNTHFTNASGLHDRDHYTTPEDMAKLFRYALENQKFREVITTSRHTIHSTNLRSSGITLSSTLFDDLSDPTINGGVILGGKTGYTDEAGLCLASFAKKHGKEYILVTTGAPGNHKSEPLHIIDAKEVYNDLLY